jgi:hypothetical protein
MCPGSNQQCKPHVRSLLTQVPKMNQMEWSCHTDDNMQSKHTDSTFVFQRLQIRLPSKPMKTPSRLVLCLEMVLKFAPCHGMPHVFSSWPDAQCAQRVPLPLMFPSLGLTHDKSIVKKTVSWRGSTYSQNVSLIREGSPCLRNMFPTSHVWTFCCRTCTQTNQIQLSTCIGRSFRISQMYAVS